MRSKKEVRNRTALLRQILKHRQSVREAADAAFDVLHDRRHGKRGPR